jgi:hypothetical protein
VGKYWIIFFLKWGTETAENILGVFAFECDTFKIMGSRQKSPFSISPYVCARKNCHIFWPKYVEMRQRKIYGNCHLKRKAFDTDFSLTFITSTWIKTILLIITCSERLEND